MISLQNNSYIDEKLINQKSKTEIIELYRSNMVNENKTDDY